MVRMKAESTLPLEAKSLFLERTGHAFAGLLRDVYNLEITVTETKKDGESLIIKSVRKSLLKEAGKADEKDADAKALEKYDLSCSEVEEVYKDSLLQPPSLSLTMSTKIPSMGERVSISGKLTLVEKSVSKCAQTVEQEYVFKMFGVGFIAERIAKKGFYDGQRRELELFQQWADVRADLVATPEGRLRLLAGQVDLRHLPWAQKYYSEMLPEGGAPLRTHPTLALLEPTGDADGSDTAKKLKGMPSWKKVHEVGGPAPNEALVAASTSFKLGK